MQLLDIFFVLKFSYNEIMQNVNSSGMKKPDRNSVFVDDRKIPVDKNRDTYRITSN